MTNVAENRVLLFEEVKELREKEKKHVSAMWDAKEGRRLAEARLDEANKKIKVGEKTWGKSARPGRRRRPTGPWRRTALKMQRSMPKPRSSKFRLAWIGSNLN